MIIQEFYSNIHEFDYSIPHFITRVRGTCIVVTPDLISEVLYIPKVKFVDYPDYDRLRTVSKDELLSLFYEILSSWDDRQNTSCSSFVKSPRFLNIVMTYVLHHLSHYNSITEPHARFLLSLLEGLTIDFSCHFILSLIDVYRDTVTHDKLIFPSAITRILHHTSVSYPESPHFSVIYAIDTATVRQSEAQLRPNQPQTKMATPLASSAPSSSAGGVTLEAVMGQLQHMDARLDTLSDELCQVNTRVSHIARQQARLGGFVASPSPSPEASEDDDGDSDYDDKDEDASSSGDDEMTT